MPRDPNKALEAMEKYMNPVPEHLANLVEYLNRNMEELPEWEVALIGSIKASVQYRIRDHFEASAMTRQKFVSMAADIWKESGTDLFNLTEQPRKVLGYLPKEELKRLNDLVFVPIKTEIEELRAKVDDYHDKMRSSEADRAEEAELMARESFFFNDLEDHKDMEAKWAPLCAEKAPIIAELEQREEFLEEIEEFESKAAGDKDRYKKANSLALADENKFRAFAAKKLKELDSKAIQLCRSYEEKTGREFQIDGIKYLEMIKEQKFGRSANPGLSLAKLRPEAISAAERQKYSGGVASNLVVNEDSMTKKKSLHDQGGDAKIIRKHSGQHK